MSANVNRVGARRPVHGWARVTAAGDHGAGARTSGASRVSAGVYELTLSTALLKTRRQVVHSLLDAPFVFREDLPNSSDTVVRYETRNSTTGALADCAVKIAVLRVPPSTV